jgi:hypothetical protein
VGNLEERVHWSIEVKLKCKVEDVAGLPNGDALWPLLTVVTRSKYLMGLNPTHALVASLV